MPRASESSVSRILGGPFETELEVPWHRVSSHHKTEHHHHRHHHEHTHDIISSSHHHHHRPIVIDDITDKTVTNFKLPATEKTIEEKDEVRFSPDEKLKTPPSNDKEISPPSDESDESRPANTGDASTIPQPREKIPASGSPMTETTTMPPPLPLWSIVRHIPNAVTVAGLVCGLLALRECALGRGGHCTNAAWLIMMCYYMDVLDGALARVMNATSPIGATLDDVADFVCHGVAPIGLICCMNTPHQHTLSGKLAEVPYDVLALCACLGVLAVCRTTHIYATKSQTDKGLYYHGLPTTYVGPGIATVYVLTESAVIANIAAIGLTILLLPLQTRVAEGMLESQAWKRWSFLGSLFISLASMKFGALCTFVLISLYTFYPKIFEWDQRYPHRLTGAHSSNLTKAFLWRKIFGGSHNKQGSIEKKQA